MRVCYQRGLPRLVMIMQLYSHIDTLSAGDSKEDDNVCGPNIEGEGWSLVRHLPPPTNGSGPKTSCGAPRSTATLQEEPRLAMSGQSPSTPVRLTSSSSLPETVPSGWWPVRQQSSESITAMLRGTLLSLPGQTSPTRPVGIIVVESKKIHGCPCPIIIPP